MAEKESNTTSEDKKNKLYINIAVIGLVAVLTMILWILGSKDPSRDTKKGASEVQRQKEVQSSDAASSEDQDVDGMMHKEEVVEHIMEDVRSAVESAEVS